MMFFTSCRYFFLLGTFGLTGLLLELFFLLFVDFGFFGAFGFASLVKLVKLRFLCLGQGHAFKWIWAHAAFAVLLFVASLAAHSLVWQLRVLFCCD